MTHLGSTADTEPAGILVSCLSDQSHELGGNRYTPDVVFEICSAGVVLRSSEVLSGFRIVSMSDDIMEVQELKNFRNTYLPAQSAFAGNLVPAVKEN